MQKHSSNDFVRRSHVAGMTALTGAHASDLGRRQELPAVFPCERRKKARPLAPLMGQEKDVLRKGLGRRVVSVPSLYAYATVIEGEAIMRYREFAAHMAEHGNEVVAELFRSLARFGAGHAYQLAKKTAGMALPKLAAVEYSWLDQEAPVPEAHAFVMRMLTPRMALEIALRAEERARAFFENVIDDSGDAGIREAAREMARDKQAHIAWVNDVLARVPKPYQPSEEQPGDPTIPRQL
jgi:rubrerythrin